MTKEGYPTGDFMTDTNDTPVTGHQDILDQQLALSQERRTQDLQLIELGPMRDLAPDADWAGKITATGEYGLSVEERATFNDLLLESVAATEQGGQVACMDGRELEGVSIAPGPKTAGGTYGNAFRILLASNAAGQAMSYDEALDISMQIDERNGFKPGGHDLSQCGAYNNGIYGIIAVAENADEVAAATADFTATVGGVYSGEIQDKLIAAAQALAPSLAQLIPAADEAPKHVEARNPQSCPELSRDHAEITLAVFLREGITLNNSNLIARTKQQFGKEIQSFGYNWDYHLKIAKELGSKVGAYYLQAVPSQDISVLTRLTDGSVGIVGIK